MANGSISKQTYVSIGLVLTVLATVWIIQEKSHERFDRLREQISGQGQQIVAQTEQLKAVAQDLLAVKTAVNRNTESLGTFREMLVRLQTEVRQLQRNK